MAKVSHSPLRQWSFNVILLADDIMTSSQYCCPNCKGHLDEHGDAYYCRTCSITFPVLNGIPDFRLRPNDTASLFYDATALHHAYRFLESDHCFYRVKDHFPDLVGFEMRRRELLRFLMQVGNIFHSPAVLDLGSADGIMTQILVDGDREIVCADLSQQSLLRAFELLTSTELGGNKFVRLVQCEASDLPFMDRSFDIVICTEVIEHVDNPGKLAREISRVMKRHAWLYLTTPNSKGSGILYGPLKKLTSRLGFHLKERRSIYKTLEDAAISHNVQSHLRELSFEELNSLLRESGFSILMHKAIYVTYLDIHMFSKLFRGLDRVLCFYPLIRIFAFMEYFLSGQLPLKGHVQVCVSRSIAR